MTARKVQNHIELDEDDARAGQTGMHVRYVLIFSIILALVGMALIAIFFT